MVSFVILKGLGPFDNKMGPGGAKNEVLAENQSTGKFSQQRGTVCLEI